MKLTAREKSILKMVMTLYEGKAQLNVTSQSIDNSDIKRAIWGVRKAPQSANETALWTMKNLCKKFERHLKLQIIQSKDTGRGNFASFTFPEPAIDRIREWKIEGKLE